MSSPSDNTGKRFIDPGHDQSYFFKPRPTTAPHLLQASKELTFHVCTSSDVTVHTHENYYEIFIVTAGKLTHHFDGHATVMKTGDAFFLFPGQHHQLSPHQSYTSRHINLTCSARVAAQILGDDPAQLPRQSIHLSELELRVVNDLQESIFKSASEAYQNTAVRTLLSYVAGLFALPDRDPMLSEQMPKWLADFVDHLQTLDFSQPLHLSELYAISGRSQPFLSKQFKKHMGQTLVSYLNRLKLSHACNLLRGTTFSLAEVAQASGFDSYPHFSRLFKETYGLSPQQYRNAQHPPLG